MKKIIAIILILSVCLSLTSCSYRFLSVESLIRPPKISGEDSVLQSAFYDSVSDYDDVVMKTPITGKYRSSYILFDINDDGVDEAVVLYSVPAEDNFVVAAVFNYLAGEWSKVSEIKGYNEEIYEINFADVNGDGCNEIFLSWSGDYSSTDDNDGKYNFNLNRNLTVYSYDSKKTSLVLSETYTNLFMTDLNNNDSDEIVIFKINYVDTFNKTSIRIISLYDDFSVCYDNETNITDMIEINNIINDKIIDSNRAVSRIFVDGTISEQGIVTEIIEIDENNFNITLPLYNDNKTLQPKTLRNNSVVCIDVDEDGYVEIPTLERFPHALKISDEKKLPINLVVWSSYNSNKFDVKFKSVLNSKFGYIFNIPEEFIGNISVIYDEDNSNLTFYSINTDGEFVNALFSCKNFTVPEWDENNFSYIKLYENDTYVYGYLIFKADNYDIYEKYIKENFYAF